VNTKSIVLTGATGGLGQVILIESLKRGHRVFMINRSLHRTKELLSDSEIRKFKDSVDFFIADFASQEWLTEFEEQLQIKKFNASVLINNAAINTPIGNTWEININELKTHFAINFFTPVSLMYLLIPHFINQGEGAVINISGGGATKPMPYFSPYAASKTALVRLTENLALELTNLNVSVNAVAPGFLATKIHDDSISETSNLPIDIKQSILQELQSGGHDPLKAAMLIIKIFENRNLKFSGNLLSAIWDQISDPLLASNTLTSNRFKLRRVEK